MKLHPLAVEANRVLEKENPVLLTLLSDLGKRLFFPQGIITQSNEAKKYAKNYDATLGIATEDGHPMHLDCVQACFKKDFKPEDIYPYAPSRGVTKLRQFWQEKMLKENPLLVGKAISQPLVTTALSHGLAIVGDLFLNPGDVVISPDKYWGNYRFLWAEKLGAQLVTFPMFNQDLSSFNFGGFEKTLAEHAGKRILIAFNFPNNPTGYSPTAKEAEKLRDIIKSFAEKGSKFVVVCDDAYFGMVWEKEVIYESIFSYLANVHENVLVVKADGCTKEGFMWGFRVGFLTFGIKGLNAQTAEVFETKVAGSIRGTLSSSSMPGQSILYEAFRSPDFAGQLAEKKHILFERYQEIKKHAYDPKYKDLWDVYPCQSGYFICLRLKKVNAETLRKHLLMTHGVGTVSAGDTDLRIAFSCLEKESIGHMMSLTAKAVSELS